MSEKPKPCPFCGGAATEPAMSVLSGLYIIECVNLGEPGCAVAPGVRATSRAEAIRRWNTRQGEGR